MLISWPKTAMNATKEKRGFGKIRVEVKSGDQVLTTFELAEEQFKTGSRGFHAQGKVELEGKRYQANFLLVEIGSKPKKS